MNQVKGPIGVFDSGYGGLTVLSEFIKALPQYDFLYLGDNARSPYGSRSFDVVYEYTLQAVTELFSRGCHLVVLACNTASAKALRTIQQNDLPKMFPDRRVLGVIRPSTESLGSMTRSKHVGILATEGTVRSESYVIELAKFAPDCSVVQHACPMWVPLIENNLQFSEAGKVFIKNDVEQLLQKDSKIDTILLGCTHYPIVSEYLRSIVPQHIQIITQGSLVAEKLVNYLERHPEINERCIKDASLRFLTSENNQVFDRQAESFIGRSIRSEHIHF
ncbi:MAG: glutamate racemase [Cryomorphaceae bacterium]|jgi:glutamate racemase|nr:glutamate racemase [Cryomorphaceae bacterium]